MLGKKRKKFSRSPFNSGWVNLIKEPTGTHGYNEKMKNAAVSVINPFFLHPKQVHSIVISTLY